MALDAYLGLRKLIPHGEVVKICIAFVMMAVGYAMYRDKR